MNCRSVRKLLPLHAGGELDLRERCAVDTHLARCLNCFRESQHLERDVGLLRSASRSLPPLPGADRLAKDVLDQVEGPPLVVSRLPQLVAISGWAAALVLGVFLWQQLPGASTQRSEGPVLAPARTTTTGYEAPFVDRDPWWDEGFESEHFPPSVSPSGPPRLPAREAVEGSADSQFEPAGEERAPPDVILGRYVVIRDV